MVSPQLNDVQRDAVDSLRAHGIAIVAFADLFGEALWNEARTDIESFVRETEAETRAAGAPPSGKKTKDQVIVRRFDRETGEDGSRGAKPRFSIDGPWLQIAASAQLLDIVNSYRAQLTRIFYLDNWFTVPYPEADERVASQRWHRDPDDVHVVKVFTYFSDVDAEAGPFEYVRGSSTGGRYGDLWPWGEARRYPPTEELEAATAAEDRMTVTGRAGTVIICDTGGFHRGGFARTKPRVLSISTYLPPDVKEGRRRFTVDFQGREDSLAAQVRAALA